MLDVIIHNGIVVTMEAKGGVGIINDGSVGIKGDEISCVGETEEILKDYKAHRYIDANGMVVMPGLVDAHSHTGIALLKGLAQDSNNWLQGCIWPLIEEMTEEERVIGSKLMIMEAIKAGTTTMCDFDSPMTSLVKNHIELGTRACVAHEIIALPRDASDTPIGELYPLDSSIENEAFNENIKLIETYHNTNGGRITCMLGPQAPDRVSKEMLVEVQALSEKMGYGVHMHVACGERENNQIIKRYGKRTIPFLKELGLLNERMLGVHLSVATKDELSLYAKSGAGMVLCSGSEAIIDGSVPPAYDFDKFSKRLALGSDQTPGGNCSSMFNEMKFTAILNKCKYADPTLFPSWKVLRMATIDGATAIGLGDKIGSLKPGKKADVILIDFNKPHLTPIIFNPLRNIIPNLVYAANGSDVHTSIINGKVVMDNRKLTLVDEKKVINDANIAARNLVFKVGGKITATNSELVQMMKKDRI